MDIKIRGKGYKINLVKDSSVRRSRQYYNNIFESLRKIGLSNDDVEATLENNPVVRYVFIMDTNGNVLYRSFGKGFPVGLAAANALTSGVQTQMKILATDEGLIWDVANPVLHGRAGVVRIGASDKQKRALRKTHAEHRCTELRNQNHPCHNVPFAYSDDSSWFFLHQRRKT